MNLKFFQPGNLVLVDREGSPTVFIISEVKVISSLSANPILKIISDEVVTISEGKSSNRMYYLYEDEVKLVSPSIQEVPLEDWASLIHLLHPQLRFRVQETLLGDL